MNIGDQVRVVNTSNGGDSFYAGRYGIVVKFDPSLGWQTPRALLAPEMFVCVHFLPRSEKEKRGGSPVAMINSSNLRVDARNQKRGTNQ